MIVCEICKQEVRVRSSHSEIHNWCIPCGIEAAVSVMKQAVMERAMLYKERGIRKNPYTDGGKAPNDVLRLGQYLLFEEVING